MRSQGFVTTLALWAWLALDEEVSLWVLMDNGTSLHVFLWDYDRMCVILVVGASTGVFVAFTSDTAMATTLRLRAITSHLSRRLVVPYSPSRTSLRPFAMTSPRDVSLQADIGKMKLEADGSFKRAPSSFRNSIQNDGQFTAERGS